MVEDGCGTSIREIGEGKTAGHGGFVEYRKADITEATVDSGHNPVAAVAPGPTRRFQQQPRQQGSAQVEAFHGCGETDGNFFGSS